MTLSGDGSAAAIRQAASSLRSNPDQFTYSINIIGTQATGGPGGPGIVAQAFGGAPGSSAVGFHAGGMNSPSVSIAADRADDAFRQQVMAWATELENVAELVEKGEPPQARGLVERLATAGLPAALAALITGLINLAS